MRMSFLFDPYGRLSYVYFANELLASQSTPSFCQVWTSFQPPRVKLISRMWASLNGVKRRDGRWFLQAKRLTGLRTEEISKP